MKKSIKFILLTVCLFAMLVAGVLAACVSIEENKITVTVDVKLDGQQTQTFTVDKNAEFYSKLNQYLPSDTNGLTFAGWFTTQGEQVTSSTRWESDGTVVAKWNAAYTTEYYFETPNGFELDPHLTFNGFGEVGTFVTAEQKQIAGYAFDAANANNVTSATLGSGTTLKLYYKCQTYTLMFDKNLPSATGAMNTISCPYGDSIKLPANAYASDYMFGYWNTKPDGSGTNYGDEAYVNLSADTTLYAMWEATYYEQVFTEQLDGTFESQGKYLRVGVIGSQVTAKETAPEYYVLDEDNPNAVVTAVCAEDLVLKVYYKLVTHNVTYRDDNTVVAVKHGADYTVRTPVDPTVTTYSSSLTGDGREYSFGSTITVLKDVTLYPVIVEIFEDIDGSGDKVEIRRNFSGRGAAVLIKDDVRHQGFLKVAENSVTFEVSLSDNTEVHGKLLDDNKFVYRNEDEVGTYFWFDYLYDEFYEMVMLSLDGYGFGIYAMPANDGSSRVINYPLEYALTEDGDYEITLYNPSTMEVEEEGWFQIVKYNFENFPEMTGYFMFWGYEYGDYVLVYNWQVEYTKLFLDGYGNATLYDIDGGEIVSKVEGVYYATDDYTDDEPEYYFVIDGDVENAIIFTAFAMADGDDTAYIFMIKRGEFGLYKQTEEADYPQLYLDGYGGAQYFATASDKKGRVGYYTIESDGQGGYSVLITYYDEAGGKMRVTLDTAKMLFSNNTQGDFVIQDGVLTEYLGESTIIEIPEGVTAIADGVFKDKNITTLTLPSTIQTIGLYAFQNSASSTEKSLLTTIYINAVTPPVLADDPNSSVGPNPFRWLQDNAKIFVPDGCEEAYLQAESWANYTKFITTVAKENAKPEFEVVDGVLLSYNNKDKNPHDVKIKVPDGVTEIAASVFSFREYIVEVDLNGATVIGNRAFYGCINLASVTFNAETVSIGSEAFYLCNQLDEVDLGGVQTIGDNAFYGCYKLAKVSIGSKINYIGAYAFSMCSVDVYQEVVDGETQEVVVPHDLVVTITATTAPALANYVFLRSQPRIYVNSYEVGVAYADNAEANWKAYANSLRVKRDGQLTTYYSKSNMGAPLVLGDNADFDSGSYTGLYKIDGNYLYVAWFNYSAFAHTLTIDEQRASTDEFSGELRGFRFVGQDDLEYDYVFVSAGKQIIYTNGDETLVITFGNAVAQFNDRDVNIDIVNYRMQFNLDGYIYKLSLTIDETFTYERTKIVVEKSYTAADGSTLVIRFGDSIYANGVLYGVLQEDEFYCDSWSWSLKQVGDNVYTWTRDWRGTTYYVTATLDGDTFTYVSGVYSYREYYRNGLGDLAIVTVTMGEVSSIHIQFKTANDSLETDVEFTAQADGTYTVVVDIDIDGAPSEFNGTYTLTLNSGTKTFTLQQLS